MGARWPWGRGDMVRLWSTQRWRGQSGKIFSCSVSYWVIISEPLFRQFLRRDYEAVAAALEYEWSSGQVEGQINRLKLVKRQMYGRACFDLLRQRVLGAA